ncbi:hypothetical protein BJ165DRAFT_1532629 [Panaeolus papilionaceus]|nr:hypothetical protein BJ165DRAFT_1532629 [Panaeolus papilionaceus]
MPSLYLSLRASALLPPFVHHYTMQGQTLHIRPLCTEGAKGDNGRLDPVHAPPSRVLSSLASATLETTIADFRSCAILFIRGLSAYTLLSLKTTRFTTTFSSFRLLSGNIPVTPWHPDPPSPKRQIYAT